MNLLIYLSKEITANPHTGMKMFTNNEIKVNLFI